MYKSLTIVALIVLFFAGQASADSHTDPDFDDDGIVNLADYGLFISHWGTREGGDNWDAKFDLDGDGVIGLGDYGILVSNWGKTFPVSPSGGGGSGGGTGGGTDGGSSDGGVLVTGITNLTSDSERWRFHTSKPFWSPDGRFILFQSLRDPGGLYKMDSDGANLIHLTGGYTPGGLQPAWSPDGRFIAFTSNRDSPEDKWQWTDIYIVGSDGNNLTRVNLPERVDSSPAWSPDGRFIAFSSSHNGDDIYRVEIKFGPGGETIVIFPDQKLNLAIGHSLRKKGVAPSITSSEMATLRTLSASNKDISDLTGLEHATNLTELNLTSNRIVDITPLTSLTNLTRLSLGGNNISDLAPLVANTGLGRGDEVDVRENALSTTSRNTHIPALQARGVNVRF